MAARLEVSGHVVVYSGDIVAFGAPAEALADARLYVGDGSSLTASLVRRHPSGVLVGHTTVRAQLGWLSRKRGCPARCFDLGGTIGLGDTGARGALSNRAAERDQDCEVSPRGTALELDF